jgi:hypothetical protein
MKHSRRVVYTVLLLLWFTVIFFPAFAIVLASRQQIQVGSDPQRHVRIFLLQEPDTRGVGVEWVRPAAGSPGCSETRLTYLMWRGEGENARFCSCFDSRGEFRSSHAGSCQPTSRQD